MTDKGLPAKRKFEFSKLLALLIVLGDIGLSAATLYLTWLAIGAAYSGSLPYLTALIGAFQAATGYVLGKYMDKSKAENTEGGITYANAVNTDRDC